MKIVLVNAPPSDVHAKRAGDLLEQAIKDLGHECIVMPGHELPGALQFFERQKQRQALKNLQPDVIVYCSAKNFLQVKGLRSVAITDIQFWNDEKLTNPQALRDEFTAGREYFFYTGDIDADAQWERVLQAFSQFKKWQQSGLKLVLGGHIDPKFRNIFHEKLEAYKYKQDIIVQQNDLLPAAAFCVLSTADFPDERMDILTAFNHGIPVIAYDSAISKKLCGDAASYIDLKDAKALSQQMISIYKNEAMYNHLSEKGRLVSNGYSRQQMLEQINARIQAAVNSEFS
ncbi:MAG TPA: glycosyltransferase [Chitinophagaceae bacterium]|nr:glycosyltransferase [Chitinophagaceae bacterium]